MESCIQRIKDDMEKISRITATPENGCTRFSYSKEDKQTREYLLQEMEAIGLEVKVDGVGNIRAKHIDDNEDQPSIMFGSHIDTVANGGKFDGLTGVIVGLEVMRVVKENKLRLKNPLELIIFAEEEGSNFGVTLLGSKVLTGIYKLEDLKEIRNDEDISSYDVMKDFGLDVEDIGKDVLKKGEVKAMIELHVEQGGILDAEKVPIGIVEAIAGMKTWKVSAKGVSNHAGSTPMKLRNDPMVGVSEIIVHIEEISKEKALSSTVSTVGKIHCQPNVANIISEQVDFYVDIRDVETEGVNIVVKELKKKAEEVALRRGLEIQIKLVGESKNVKLSTKIIEVIEKVAIENKYKYKLMNSGAVHDSAILTELTEVAMIFVPSVNGKSHCPEELTDYQDIKLGCDLLLNTVIKLANG